MGEEVGIFTFFFLFKVFFCFSLNESYSLCNKVAFKNVLNKGILHGVSQWLLHPPAKAS